MNINEIMSVGNISNASAHNRTADTVLNVVVIGNRFRNKQ